MIFHRFALGPRKLQVSPTLPPRKLQASPLLGALEALQVSPTLGLLKSASRVRSFTDFGPFAPSFTYCRPLASCRPHLFWAPWKGWGVGPPQECQVSPISGPSQVRSFTDFGPLASSKFHLLQASPLLGPLAALQVSPTLGLLKSARFHQFQAPRECQVSPTLGPSQAPSFTYFRPFASCRLHVFWAPWKRSRFHLLWASSRVPGFTNCGPLASARFHLLWAARKLQVSPTLGRRLHLFWAPWKRSRFQLLWASSRFPSFTNFIPPASTTFHLLWPPRKLQVSPTLGPSQAAGFTSFGHLGSAPGFTYFRPPQECQVSGPARVRSFTYFGPFASSKFHLL